ncbi:unnamed protein product [Calypogeia fissa]
MKVAQLAQSTSAHIRDMEHQRNGSQVLLDRQYHTTRPRKRKPISEAAKNSYVAFQRAIVRCWPTWGLSFLL